MKLKNGLPVFFLFCWIFPVTAFTAEALQIEGKTMGTMYHVTVVGMTRTAATPLKKRIDRRLAVINRSMSTYDPESEISRFNRWKTDTPFPISAILKELMDAAGWVHQKTAGAWDGTLWPLVQLWGFGSDPPPQKRPDLQTVQTALAETGFDSIKLVPGPALVKNRPNLRLDLASIAKGYGVDQIAALLKADGRQDFLVEIGGEVVARGKNPDGEKWRVGINLPKKNASPTAVYKVLGLGNQAMATSGDYRRFRALDGRRYTHILDPQTGYPVDNGVVSATVIAANCTIADALATALMVMGVERGLKLVESLPGVECLLITQGEMGHLRDHGSSGIAF